MTRNEPLESVGAEAIAGQSGKQRIIRRTALFLEPFLENCDDVWTQRRTACLAFMQIFA